jgi:hypothetical protein
VTVPVFRLSFKNVLKVIGKCREAQMIMNHIFALFCGETNSSLVAAEKCFVKVAINCIFQSMLEYTTTNNQCFF